MSLADYDSSASNWREQIRNNQRKTKIVVALFVAIYCAVGFLVDVFILENTYYGITFQQAVYLLLNFKVVPYAMILMLAIALLSLWITYVFYDRIMLLGTNSREITPQTAQTIQEQQLYNVVEEMTVAAGMRYIPKVYLIEADYMNAFASGYSERSAMVAITRGLIDKLNRAELQAVMAHELSHIRHFDTKLTLTVAVLSNIMLLVVDFLFYSVLFRSNNDRGNDNRLVMAVMVLRYVLPLLTVVLTLFLSRTREYMADAGCVELMRDNQPLAQALLKINQDHNEHAEHYAQEYGNTPHEQIRQSSYLFDPSSLDPVKSMTTMFSTHPSLQDRLKALGFKSR